MVDYPNQTKRKPMVDVRQYGAKGDGVTNDYAAIQSAIASNPGGTIFFPAGFYQISSPLTVTSTRTALIGAARDATFITQTVANTDIIRIGDNITQVTGNTIRDLTLVMSPSVAAGTTNYGVNIRYAGLAQLENIRIYANDRLWRGVNVSDVIGFVLLSSRVEDTVSYGLVSGGTGTLPRGTVDVRVEGCVFLFTGSDSIKFNQYADGHYIWNNQIYGIQGAYGLNISPGALGNFGYMIRGNDISSNEGDGGANAGGIYVGQYVVADISNNTILGASSTAREGVKIAAGGEARIVGHSHVGSGQTGIENGGVLLLSGSTMNGAGTALKGVDVLSTATMTNITGTQFLQYPNAPIALHASSLKTTIAGNTFRIISDGGTWTGTPVDMVAAGNFGVDGSIPQVASAATITIDNSPTINITGTTTITTINGGWNGRRIHLIKTNADPVTIGGGGNIPASRTLASFGTVTLVYASGSWF